MIPKKIEKKIRELCVDDNDKYNVIMELLKFEDSGKGKANQNCKTVVEKYAKERIENEN